MSMHLRRDHEHERRRWRNGTGTTTELASFPPGSDASADFAWRVSMADVTQSGAFSRFRGVDRVIALVDGASMTLRQAGQPDGGTELRHYQPFAFDGDVSVTCEVSGPCRDLNVMTRRGRATANVEILCVTRRTTVAHSSGHQVLVVALEGNPELVGDGIMLHLATGDTVLSNEPLELDGRGRVAVVHIGAADPVVADASTCHCGARMQTCPGCESPRCVTCDPYLSDDCRWTV